MSNLRPQGKQDLAGPRGGKQQVSLKEPNSTYLHPEVSGLWGPEQLSVADAEEGRGARMWQSEEGYIFRGGCLGPDLPGPWETQLRVGSLLKGNRNLSMLLNRGDMWPDFLFRKITWASDERRLGYPDWSSKVT